MNDSNGVPSSPGRSTAQQVSSWLIVASLIVSVTITGGWCLATSVSMTPSSVLVLVVATIALWMTIYRLFILGIKRMVRSRIAQSRTERA